MKQATTDRDATALPIALTTEAPHLEACAAIMVTSDPWLTYGASLERCRGIVAHPTRETHVAFHGDEVAGFVTLTLEGALAGFVYTVAVAVPWRSQGLGRRLLAVAEARIHTAHPNVFLCVSDFNPRAQALYQRLGYEVVGELRDYIVAGRAEILMRKTAGPRATWTPP